MWRTLLRPKWLALLVLLVLVVVAFARLGAWQLSTARDDAARQAHAEQLQREPLPLDEVVAPQAGFPADGANRPVLVTGRYLPEQQFLVPGRLLEGRAGLWVVTPLEVHASGGLVPVVRGFVESAAEADVPAPDRVTVQGSLAPAESPVDDANLPEGQRASIDLGRLANDHPGRWYNAFVFAAAEEPALTSPAVERVPAPVIGGDVDWRNLGYALQWWVFAAFAVFMFGKLLADDHREGRAGERHTVRGTEREEPSAP